MLKARAGFVLPGRSKEFMRYCVVGALGVVVNTGTLVGLRRLGVALGLASPVSIEVSIVFNYLLNEAWTFRWRRARGRAAGRFARFHLVAATSGLVNFTVLLALARGLGVWYVAANLAGIGAATLVNYALNSLWTWRPPVATVLEEDGVPAPGTPQVAPRPESQAWFR